MSKTGLMAAVALAVGLDEKTAETVKIDAGFMKQYFPEVAAALRTEGAELETARIAGIEACAIDGVAHVIKAHKADRSKTPGDCALAVIQEQQKPEFKALAALKADEEKVTGLRSETANSKVPEKKAEAVEDEAKWKAEWATGKPKAEHGYVNEAQFLADKRAEARGAVKELKNRRDAA